MKRDMDLIRSILQGLESGEIEEGLDTPSVDGYDRETVIRHLELMADRNLIVTYNSSTLNMRDLGVVRMTWEGHEFLEIVRDDTRWNRIKSQMERVGSFSLQAIWSLGMSYLKQELGLS